MIINMNKKCMRSRATISCHKYQTAALLSHSSLWVDTQRWAGTAIEDCKGHWGEIHPLPQEELTLSGQAGSNDLRRGGSRDGR